MNIYHDKYAQESCYWIRDVVRLMLPAYRKTNPPVPENTLQEWVNAIHLHRKKRGHYWLGLEGYNCGKVLDVGCGPLIPACHLLHTEVFGLDPNIPAYISAGFPVTEYGAVLLPIRAEDMWMVPDAFFDTIVTQNSIDHCDDFEKAVSEIERVAKPSAMLRINVPYHAPQPTEPLEINDDRMKKAFRKFKMWKIKESSHSPNLSEALWTNREVHVKS